MVDLHQQVLDLIRQGQSWDELYRNVRFSHETKKWIGYDQMRMDSEHHRHGSRGLSASSWRMVKIL